MWPIDRPPQWVDRSRQLATVRAGVEALRDGAGTAVSAVLRYWLGQWDDALAELSSDSDDAPGLTYTFLRERWPALLVDGVAALIAGRRDQRTTADQHVRGGLDRARALGLLAPSARRP